jgi:hypothetical protein
MRCHTICCSCARSTWSARARSSWRALGGKGFVMEIVEHLSDQEAEEFVCAFWREFMPGEPMPGTARGPEPPAPHYSVPPEGGAERALPAGERAGVGP